MQTINFQNREVFFRVEGEGIPLVLIHGFCEDHTAWDDFIPEIQDLKIIRIDLPGFGRSANAEKASMEYYAAAIKSVLDHLEIEKCVLVGHSMGGYSTLAFAEQYPQHLYGFGLFHSHAYADTEQGRESRMKSATFIQKNGAIHFVKQLIPKLFAPHFLSSKRYISDRLIFQASRFAPEGIIGGLQAMSARPDRTEVLKKTKLPVLFILGEKDDLIPFDKQLEQTSFPAIASVHILAKTGHMGMLETPKKTATFVQDFCAFCVEK